MTQLIITNWTDVLHQINTKRAHDHRSQADLAHLTGYSPSAIGHYLNGRRPTPADLLLTLINISGWDLMIIKKLTDQSVSKERPI